MEVAMWSRRGRRPRWRRTAAAVSLVAAAATISVPGTARAQADGAKPLEAAPSGYDVTLVTGDVVHVGLRTGGRRTATVTAAPRPDGTRPGFQVLESGRDLTVIPSDVMSLIPQRLDAELFNVTSLAEQGYTDSRTASIPLVLTYGERALKAAISSVKTLRDLESIDAAGVSVDKSEARRFGADLSLLAAGGSRTKAAGPLAGVRKIWLDRKITATLDHSVPQISAPAAWAAGYDGSGTKVAVLDSGIDAEHPDLAGKVADERDFTGNGTASDGHGHGTHVAATIAGSGAASGGRRKGVAPGATLLNGRVLDDNGDGLTSWIIDGMEWAAKEKQADIVNMSLGSPGSGGPLTDAVGSLSERYGTLFVVAAGNLGCEACVGSPGDSPAALTVGAVDGQDRLAEFSSRGPIGPQRAVKPDVTAPGVGIVAARAAGTSLGEPVDGSYTGVSGTSMATPHVAGAAALLRNARPGLTAGELKGLLMGTAKKQAGTAAEGQGTGRVDVASALAGPVAATSGSVDFGLLTATGAQPVSRSVSYRNLTASPITLELAGEGAFAVSPATLSLPAGGTGEVTVTLDPAKAKPGWQRGELVATARGGPAERTLLSANVERKRAKLKVRGIARDGRPAYPWATVLNAEDGMLSGRELPVDPARQCAEEPGPGEQCLMVTPGTYSVLGYISTTAPGTDPADEGGRGTVLNETLVGDPELTVTGDTELVLDARRAAEVKIDTPDHRTRRNPGAATKLMWHRSPVRGAELRASYLPSGNVEERFFIQPTGRVTKGAFSVASRWRLEAPAITMRSPGLELDPDYYDPVWFSDLSEEYPRLDGRAQLQAVDAGRGRPQDLKGVNLRGSLAVIRRTEGIPVSTQSNTAAAAGATMVAIYSDRPGVDVSPGGTGVKLKVPTVRLSHEEGRRLADRLRRTRVPVTVEGVVSSPYAYDLHLREEGRVPSTLKYVVRATSLARVENTFHNQLTPDMTASEARYSWEPGETSSVDVLRPMTFPLARVDYVTADPDLLWSATAELPERPYNYQWPHPETPYLSMAEPAEKSYRPGARTGSSWFEQPMLPGTRPTSPLRREGDLLHVDMQGYVDAGGNGATAHTDSFEGGRKTDFRVYHGDDLLAEVTQRPVGDIVLPAASAAYRMEYDLENQAPWALLSTRTRTAWTFTSARPAEGTSTVIPLLLADFDLPVDLRNRTDSHRLGVTLRQQTGAATSKIGNVSLETSYDDGATWRPVRNLRSKGAGGYEATLDRPVPGFVSLRLKAADARGSTLSQEVIRAYVLR
jgi:subtilisin family serine protease